MRPGGSAGRESVERVRPVVSARIAGVPRNPIDKRRLDLLNAVRYATTKGHAGCPYLQYLLHLLSSAASAYPPQTDRLIAVAHRLTPPAVFVRFDHCCSSLEGREREGRDLRASSVGRG
jgi:hypothetical protein